MNRYLRQLNIDKDILSMKNFNVYDPMKRGQGLVLDGQSLAHVEVGSLPFSVFRIATDVNSLFCPGAAEQRGNRGGVLAEATLAMYHSLRCVIFW